MKQITIMTIEFCVIHANVWGIDVLSQPMNYVGVAWKTIVCYHNCIVAFLNCTLLLLFNIFVFIIFIWFFFFLVFCNINLISHVGYEKWWDKKKNNNHRTLGLFNIALKNVNRIILIIDVILKIKLDNYYIIPKLEL